MKTTFKILVFISVSIVTCLSFVKEKRPSDVLLMNIEALAVSEGGGAIWCVAVGSLDCPSRNIKVSQIIRY